MKINTERFYLDRNAPELILTPFLENLINHQHKAGKLNSNSFEKVKQTVMERWCEVYTSPDRVLDFDGTQFPNHACMFIIFKKSLPEDFEVCLYLKRLNEEIFLEISLNLRKQDYYAYPFNPARIHLDIENKCQEESFGTEYVDTDRGEYVIPFVFIIPAERNMLQTYNELFSKVEKLYSESRDKIVKEIKNNY